MKIRYLLPMAIFALMAGIASAGRVQPAPVVVDLDNRFAFGDQWTARTANNDVDLIGCGIRVFDDGNNPFAFGFCQATNSDGVFHFLNSFTPLSLTNRYKSLTRLPVAALRAL